MLRFRDYLIVNSAARQSYWEIKKKLCHHYASDRQAYTEGKAAFIQSILRETYRTD